MHSRPRRCRRFIIRPPGIRRPDAGSNSNTSPAMRGAGQPLAAAVDLRAQQGGASMPSWTAGKQQQAPVRGQGEIGERAGGAIGDEREGTPSSLARRLVAEPGTTGSASVAPLSAAAG